MMSPSRCLAAILGFILVSENVSAQTIDFISVPSVFRAGETLRVTQEGANLNDATTYVIVDAVSSVVLVEPSMTITEVAFPTTYTETYVGDASGATIQWGASNSAPGVVETCGFGSNGLGTCVETLPIDAFPEETVVVGFTGSVVPYTLTSSPSSARRMTSAACVGLWITSTLAVASFLFHVL